VIEDIAITGGYLSDPWIELENEIKSCTRCPLHKSRKNAVPGEGPRDAKVMFVGEAPGATEDELGRPFVGAAGRLLTMTMEAAGLKRSEVYITNVVKCRPPNNREPREEEIRACSPFLEKQLELLKPAIVVTLGNVAGKWFFERSGLRWPGVTRARGKVYRVSIHGLEIKLIPTIHPAAALYNPGMRTLLQEDLRKVREVLQESLGGGEPKPRTLLDYMKRSQSK